MNIPGPNDPDAVRETPLYFYVNLVITQLSAEAFRHAGFTRTTNERTWNASWGRQYQAKEYSLCEGWQKINHWAGAFLMGRKDRLNSRMNELRERVGDFVNFYPETYLLPDERGKLTDRWENHHLWIVKPFASSRGKGIRLVSNDSHTPLESCLVQSYLERPLLITGRKFDIRLYVLIPSISPIRVYIHDSGLARFCTHPYSEDGSISDLRMHLTNFSLNKFDKNFKRGDLNNEDIENSKWSLPYLLEYLGQQGVNVDNLQEEIHRSIIATLIAGECEIRKYHRRLIRHRHTSYEMYGVDILLDENLHPYIMEVNISPAMSGADSNLDYQIKKRLMLELLQVARIIDCDARLIDPCPGIREIEKACDHAITPERIKNTIDGTIKPWDNPTFYDYMIVRDYVEEYSRRGGFSKIFPKKKNYKTFIPCYDQLEYDDIVFFDWISMTKNERNQALQKNWNEYSNMMETIRKNSIIPGQTT